MIRVHRPPLRLGAAVLTAGLLAAGCGSPTSSAKGQVQESTTTSTIAKGPDTTAAQLRARLSGLLEEHLYLAAAVSDAHGRPDESAAAIAALGGNADSLAANMTAIFTGSDADVAKQFGVLWKKQVDIVSGQASGDLAQNAKDIGALLSSALPSLSADAVAGPLTAGDQAAGKAGDFAGLRTAVAQMVTLGSTLTGAIAKKFPDKIGGDPASAATDLLTNVTVDLRENAFLTCAATDAVLGGRNDEVTAARSALDNNAAALADAIAGAYGSGAGTTFGPLWSKHNGFFIDYATAVGAKQQTKADEAMGNLLQASTDLGAFINTSSPKISKESAAALFKTNASAVKDVIDAQAAKNYTRAYNAERIAADQMSSIATTLAPLIVAQFPNKY